MQLPNVNLNGTSRASLVEQYTTAMLAVQVAVTAVQDIEVHGRDYQGLDGNAASVAFAEHRERLRKLDSVRADLERIAIYVQSGEHLP